MNTSHRLRHPRKRKPRPVRSLVRLQSGLAILAAFLIYTFASSYLFSPTIHTVQEQEGSFSFLSTDLKEPVRPSLEHSILDAKESVVLIIYSLSDQKIINALAAAAARGVHVLVIHDPVETPDAQTILGKAVTCYGRREKGLMHNKLLVIDHSVVWIGSANMSTKSLTEQGNLVVAIRCHAIAKAIEELASRMINRAMYKEPPLEVETKESTLTLFFNPYHGDIALQSLIDRINKASRRIFVAMFTFTHPDLVSALCRAKYRGVDVRVVFDQESSRQTSKKAYLRFKREKIPCFYRTKSGLLHYKTALIDDLLVAGSCNWTKAGFTANHEALLFINPLPSSLQPWITQWWNQVELYSSKP